MDDRKRCWFRGCAVEGLPRPVFAQTHGLPATIRLCDRHLSTLDPDLFISLGPPWLAGPRRHDSPGPKERRGRLLW